MIEGIADSEQASFMIVSNVFFIKIPIEIELRKNMDNNTSSRKKLGYILVIAFVIIVTGLIVQLIIPPDGGIEEEPDVVAPSESGSIEEEPEVIVVEDISLDERVPADKRAKAVGGPVSLPDDCYECALSPDGSLMVMTLYEDRSKTVTLQLLDMNTDKPTGQPMSWESDKYWMVDDLLFTPAGDKIIVRTSDNQIYVWDVKTQQLKANVHDDGCNALAISPDGKTIATADIYGNVKQWASDTLQAIGKPLIIEKHHTLKAIAFSTDGAKLAVATTKDIYVLDSKTLETLFKLKCAKPDKIAFAGDDSKLISMGFETFEIFDLNMQGQPPSSLPMLPEFPTLTVTDFQLNPDGTQMLIGSEDCVIHLWDLKTMTVIGRTIVAPDNFMWGNDFPNEMFFTKDPNKIITIYDIDKGQGVPGTMLQIWDIK